MMKLICLLAFCALASSELEVRWFDTRVDHFNVLDERTFDQRYINNPDFWMPGGPIFIYVGGGFEVYADYLTRGLVFDITRELNGHLFALEHRYYGESKPVEDTSLENLQFLNIHQAAADIAHFIHFVKANYYGAYASQVILFGKGYGGALAAWARQKYPNEVTGAWASSAPLNAVLEHTQFMENVFNTMSQIGGPECGSVISNAFVQLEEAVEAQDMEWIEERFKLCSPVNLTDEQDVSRLFYGIASDIGRFLQHTQYPLVDEKCRVMVGTDSDNDLDAFANWFVDDLHRYYQCLNYNNDAILNLYLDEEWDSVSTIAGRRQDFWLQCSQLGRFSTSRSQEQPFGQRFQIGFFNQLCQDVFGENFTRFYQNELISRTNIFFGGERPRGLYRVFLTQGEMDPLRTLGPREDLNDFSPVTVIARQSFSRDLGSISSEDYAMLADTKRRARELIIEWIFAAIDEDGPPGPPPEPLAIQY